MKIVDAHHHFWTFDPLEYDWIGDDMTVLRRDYLPAELEKALAGTDAQDVISVQARTSIEETDFLLQQARTLPRVRGVVGWAPLKDARVGEVLDRFAANPLFKGVREITQGHPDDLFFTDDAFGRGLREVTQRGLAYDILVFADQLPSAIRFVDRHPDQRFVLDHCGKPAIQRNGLDETWRADIRRLAERPHVACKLSGLVTEVRDAAWDLELLRPYFEIVLEVFGADRVMFGSDWPVCLLRAPYGEWLETVRLLAEPLTTTERAGLFHRSAATWYRLMM